MAHPSAEDDVAGSEPRQTAAAGGSSRGRLVRLGLPAVALVALAVAAGAMTLGGLAGGGGGEGTEQAQEGAPIPAPQIEGLQAAAAAASCEVRSFPATAGDHTEGRVRYATNPPTSGSHHPEAAQDGIYLPTNPPFLTQSVHALEHGRINIQYRPGLPAQAIAQLETLAGENDGYHVLLFANQTKMPYEVAASAWGQLLACPKFSTKTFDAIRTFRAQYVDKGPESVP